jgi:hypothetical protein
MSDISYTWYGSLQIAEAMRAHETRTGQPARQIVCRKADEPAVANQLRPADVELRSDNYVQRGTLYLAGLVLTLALLACGGTADFANYDAKQESYVCPAGQTLSIENSKGAAICR